MSNNKMKGLLKGLRYISQIFDEKEPEMQIGFPTDVKHVAHIGWDGPSVTSPSWMSEFKGPSESLPSVVEAAGEANTSINGVPEDLRRRSFENQTSSTRDLPELPKSTRRHSIGASGESPIREKPRQSRRSSKNLSGSPKGNESPSQNLPDVPKKSRRKKSKDSTKEGGSSRSRRHGSGESEVCLSPGSVASLKCNQVEQGEEKGLTVIS